MDGFKGFLTFIAEECAIGIWLALCAPFVIGYCVLEALFYVPAHDDAEGAENDMEGGAGYAEN